jgi:DNA modification methylase
MDIIRTGEADLVLTSPPYFSEETGTFLEKPRKQQTELAAVRAAVTSYARSFQAVYDEIRRILKPGGVLVTQLKDIHYGGVLMPVVAIHREMAEATGLYLLTRVFWHKFSRRSRSCQFHRNPVVGAYRADEVEEIMVFSDHHGPPGDRGLVELDEHELQQCRSPLWVMGPAGPNRLHPHKSPSALLRRMIALYSRPGELVVDPFAGSGTTLQVAARMGRRAVGYEIQQRHASPADAALSLALRRLH